MRLRQAVKVPKKNLFDGVIEIGWIDFTSGLNSVHPSRTRTRNFTEINSNERYVLSSPDVAVNDIRIMFYDVNKNFISHHYTWTSGVAFIAPSNAKFLRFGNATTNNVNARYQIEQGTTATPFEPYQEINRKASRLKEWEYVRLDGSLNWVTAGNHTGFKRAQIPISGYVREGIVENADGSRLKPFTSVIEENMFDLRSDGVGIWVAIPNALTGFTDAQTPTAQQWKDFFTANPYQLVYRLATPQHTPNWTEYPSVFKQYEPKLRTSVKVPKKNLFDGLLERGSIGGSGTKLTGFDDVAIRSKNPTQVNPNTVYTFSSFVGDLRFFFYDSNMVYINLQSFTPSPIATFATPSNARFVHFRLLTTDLNLKIQLEPGTTATPHEPYTEVNRPTTPRWQPVYQLPFTFERNSLGLRSDGLLVAHNQPRLEGKGIRVEEGTENLWAIHGRATSFNVGKEWWSFSPVSSGIHTTKLMARSKLGARLRLTQNGGAFNHYATLSEEWQLVEWTNNYTAFYLLHDTSQLGDIEIREMQVEAKPYPTSHTDRIRSAESLILPNAIPSESGTIEFDVDFVVRNPNGSNQPIFHSNNGFFWLMRYADNNLCQININNIRRELILQWQNKRYSFRVQYTKTNVKVWRDHVLVIDSAIAPSTFTQSTMHVGCDNNKQRQTDLTFYNLTIRDDVTGVSKKWI